MSCHDCRNMLNKFNSLVTNSRFIGPLQVKWIQRHTFADLELELQQQFSVKTSNKIQLFSQELFLSTY